MLLGRNQFWLAQMWAVGCRAGQGGRSVWRQRITSQRLSRAAPLPGLTWPAQPADQRVTCELGAVTGLTCCHQSDFSQVFPLKSDSVLWEITRWLTSTSTTPLPQTTSASTITAGGGPLRGPSHIPGAHTGQNMFINAIIFVVYFIFILTNGRWFRVCLDEFLCITLLLKELKTEDL